jgi:hypothetical protein
MTMQYSEVVNQHISLKQAEALKVNEVMRDAIRWNIFYNAAYKMDHNGSDFAGALANAYYKADAKNKTKLEETFLDVFMHYMDASDRALVSK